MFVVQLPSGNYRGAYKINGRRTGRTFPTRSEAVEWATAAEAQARAALVLDRFSEVDVEVVADKVADAIADRVVELLLDRISDKLAAAIAEEVSDVH